MEEKNNIENKEINNHEDVIKAFEKAWKAIKALRDDGGEE